MRDKERRGDFRKIKLEVTNCDLKFVVPAQAGTQV
jgi:hypothetical protein